MLRTHNKSLAPTSIFHKKLPKKHCKQDLACQHCCSCWQTHKSQYKTRLTIFQQKIQKLNDSLATQTNLNKDLIKELGKLRKQLEEHQDIQGVKSRIKEEMLEEVRKQVQVEIFMNKERISDLEEENKQITQQLQQNIAMNSKLTAQLTDFRTKSAKLQESFQLLATENQVLELSLSKLQKQHNQSLQRIQTLQDALNHKTQLITQFQKTCSQLEDKYMLQKTQCSNKQFDNRVLAANARANENYLSQLTSNAEENMKNMRSLEKNNNQLKFMVAQMSDELLDGRATEGYLKDRLAWTQGLASYHSQKVQLMKADLVGLKYNL